MMKNFAFFLLLSIILAGCASSPKTGGWTKSGANADQISRDLTACQKSAPGKGAGRFARGMRQTPQQGDINSCMRGKGYQSGK